MANIKKETYQEAVKLIVKTVENKDLEITINPPIAMSMMAVDNIQGDVTREANLIANQSGVSIDVISALPLREYGKLSVVMQDFLS